MNAHALARKRAQAVKAKIISLWQHGNHGEGNHNQTDIARKVKRSRAYVWEVLLKAKLIKRKR